MPDEAAMRAIEELKAMSTPYDHSREREYIRLMQEFMTRAARFKRAAGLPGGGSPFIDVTAGVLGELPDAIKSAFAEWAADAKVSRAGIAMCRAYVRFRYVEPTLDEERRSLMDIDGPLIELLREGGQFFPHHTGIIVGANAMVMYVRS